MDGFGIVYLIDNAQQFWSGVFWKGLSRRRALIPLSELEDILKIPVNASLSLLDATLKRSISFSASYHGTSLKKNAVPYNSQFGACRAISTEPSSARTCV
jgi:hypothetical protein